MNIHDLPDELEHDPDHEELLAAARHVAADIGTTIAPVDLDAAAHLLIHRDADSELRRASRSRGAMTVGAGHLFEVIDGERLASLGMVSRHGGMRVLIVTRQSIRAVELATGDAQAIRMGAALLGAS